MNLERRRRADALPAWRGAFVLAVVLLAACAGRAHAQPPVTDRSRFEFAAATWLASPSVTTQGERAGIPGTPIDFRSDFGLTGHVLPVLQGAIRTGRRHLFSAEYIPIRYTTNAALGRDVTFAGAVYPAGTSTQGIVSWQALSADYEYDVSVRRRVATGIVFGFDWTDVQVRLRNASTNELTSASVQYVPAAGLITRVRATKTLVLTGKASGSYVPDKPNQEYGGHLLNARVGGTLALGKTFAADLGVRVIDIRHLGKADSGTMRMSGVYFGVVARR